ncbi:MAG TPA: 3D domain-containing protein [Pyrinomonadaceae bacterium]|jgi:3D (Asp-Asp-Asp) domain-containing protein|nr:3D domain-containing protein [Pyrinomonadaceae bacterium]
MKISTILGSALGVLLVFSVISYAQAFIQTQDAKRAVTPEQVLEVAGQVPETESASTEKAAQATAAGPSATYSATAYSLRGRTASGQYVTRGLIAADPRILPLGTRVRLEAGPWSGEYLVADTGGAIRGRKIDIWTPSSREAMQFGRRPVKVTVLSFPAARAKSIATRRRAVANATPAVAADSAAKQEK